MRTEKDEMEEPEKIVRSSFESFKKSCENYEEVCRIEGIVDDKTFKSFYKTKIYYGFPSKGERFKLVRLPGYTEWVPIDAGLADIIVYLNEHGYPTKYCCEGHKYENYRGGYIYFEALPEEKQERLLNLAFGLMLSDQVYMKAEVSNDEVTLRFRPNIEDEHSHDMMLGALQRVFYDFI